MLFLRFFILGIFIFLMVSPVISQTDSSLISIKELSQMSLSELLNVKVTAQKRVERIEEVPLSVSSFNEDQILLSDIDNVSGLESLTPGLRFSRSGSDARLSIRGTRTNDIRTGSAQVIGVFVDGIYMSSTTQAMNQLVDANRIEVLRGPQGTLYGRNTFGGAVNIWSNLPHEAFEASAKLKLGNYNQKKLSTYVNIPINNTLQVRIAGMVEKRNGYVENLKNSGVSDDLKDENQWYLRSTFKWEPNDNFEGILRISNLEQKINGDGAFGYMIIGSVINTQSFQTDLNGEFIPGNPRNGTFGATPDESPYKVYRDYPYSRSIVNTQTNLSLTYNFDKVSIKSISAYNFFRIRQEADGDLSDRPFSVERTPSLSKDFFQELQIISKETDPLEWIAGLYFQQSNFGDLEERYGSYIYDEIQTAVDHDNNPLTPTQTTGILSPGYEWATTSETKLNIFSIFSHASYSINEQLRISAGIRYNIEDKGIKTWWLPMSWSPDIMKVNDQSKMWNHVTWHGGFDYSINNKTMLYINASNGFRAGGFNTKNSPKPSYEEEIVNAYELGLKNAATTKIPQLNVALFYNQYQDMQSQELLLQPGGSTVLPVTSNAGNMNALGTELELAWVFIEKLQTRATFAYLFTEFGDYIVSNPFELGDDKNLLDDGYINLKGSKIPLSPKYSSSVQLSYKYEFKNGSFFKPYFQSYFSSAYWTYDINAPGTQQQAYTKSDFRIVWSSKTGLVNVDLFAKNIENNAVLNRTVISASGMANIWANYGNPRTFGIEMRIHFKK